MREKQYTPDMVARNVKQRGNGVIEIARYNEGHMKANMAWPWFLIVAGMTLYDIYFQQGMFNDIQWAISVDWALEDSWRLVKGGMEVSGIPITSDAYLEFKMRMLNKHPDAIYWGWFYILFPLFWFCLLISPNWRPLRIDSKRRLIYFWSWGKFYIAQYPVHLKDNPDGLCWFLEAEMFKSWMHRETMGSLILHIPYENPEVQKKVAVPIGTYRPVCEYQNYLLRDFLLDYMCSDDGDKEYARYFKKEKRIWLDYLGWFYRFSLFPARGHNEKKTEAKIQAWLEKYGDGQ
ncbi:hypothetical protein [Aggregatibacter aphrophilus]|uniref:Uncharacterized protein n=2 Tax=Aggregatibacter aphrophilus TaxID=732 RepID=A0A336N8X4_AGGAP|nr:hypothetical protein [Aggregatibacter aphrophilus]KNE84786.1 hypothetical protein ATCC33389_0209210 [Aggregatibacter aphrophilus ATCC 33389]OBY54898.1 hypothetical protein BBB51_02915 [Aggregatibacter aphrophilus]RDE84564.1 hypothetical protein DPW00_09950 [Aggregatibacter aphrophilus]SSZ30881.1 Uncharacterised protein [Aggregatibacter aphrophilus]VEF42973.1 Uncharacterised protein [Aggregatibacter aphrophilus ATCC 33389]